MALVSPGVEVTIVDQSQYLPAPTNSIPLVVLATAQNKANASGTGVAAATSATNANKLFQVTSQRDLVDLYGSPFFYTSSNGTPVQGYELNEYGLLAAYSLLGVTNRCFVLRADIDLASLVGQAGRPTSQPVTGTTWLDATNSTWGIYEFNATTGAFVAKDPIVITDPDFVDNTGFYKGSPLVSIGNIGDYAVNTIEASAGLSPIDISATHTYFYKVQGNVWVPIGSSDWYRMIPTVQGNAPSTLTQADTFTITMSNGSSASIAVPASPNNTVYGLASAITALGWRGLSATVRNGRLCINHSQANLSGNNETITLAAGTGSALTAAGLTAGVYYRPEVVYAPSSQMPNWSSSQLKPRPSGSVWIKVGAAGAGLVPVVSKYDATTQRWVNNNVYLAKADWDVSASLDASGGKAVPVGTVYGQYEFNGGVSESPVYLNVRKATGATTVVGAVSVLTGVGITGGVLTVNVTSPITGTLSSTYSVTIPAAATSTQFVTAWVTANIPFTTASVSYDGAVILEHTEGGEIVMHDYNASGVSANILSQFGFVAGTTAGCKPGPAVDMTFAVSGLSAASPGVGTGANVTLKNTARKIEVLGVSGGSGFVVGDTIKVLGTSLGGAAVTNDIVVVVTSVSGGAVATAQILTVGSGSAITFTSTQLSNWAPLDYITNEGAPVVPPVNNTNWFFSVIDQVDIMVQSGGEWKGYKNVEFDLSGHPKGTFTTSTTDTNGVLVSATAPTTQSDGTALVPGDLWLDTSDLENYPMLSRWITVGTESGWEAIDNTDQISSRGIVFADARWASTDTVNPANDPIQGVSALLISNYVDLDVPAATLYPQGTLLFNTRRSGYNVKQYRVNYFNSVDFPDVALPTQRDAWVSVSGNKSDGSPYMGRKAQRAVVVQALNAAIATNSSIRDEDNAFNLIAAPNYPELQPGMVTLNNDRGMTSFIIGDTPLRLSNSATDIQAWANNTAGAAGTGEDGCVTRDTYLGLFYPSGTALDLSGNQVVVPASHMMLRTFLRSDNVSYPWLAPAGTRRGTIDNATSIGYIDAKTGEFQVTKTSIGVRDVLYTNSINPLVFFTGVGLLNYGNKTSFNSSSALDRINVARLVAFLRRQLTLAARPFVFEPNDALTRNQITAVIQTQLVELVAKRGLYDYLVVCDASNNTPARIDRNELWVDVAIEPVKAAEFIYIPVRLMNTGEISGV